MLLAIDTSTSLTGLALCNERGPLAECVWESRRNHTAQLLPQLDMLLRHVGAERSELTAVGVALGPGSWSGLRVGLSIAKGLVLAGGLALLGVDTLELLAYQHARPDLALVPLIRLGRERFAAAEFRLGSLLERRGAARNTELGELCATLEGPALFCGDLDDEARATIQGLIGERAHFPSPAANLRRPAFLAELAWQRLAAGERDDLVTLEPLYLSEAVKPK